jgi:hypothetical protein
MNIPGTFGLVTVEKWVDYQRNGIELKTIYNGHDITHRCIAADDRAGWALILRKRDGHPYIDRDRNTAAKALLVGSVEFKVE